MTRRRKRRGPGMPKALTNKRRLEMRVADLEEEIGEMNADCPCLDRKRADLQAALDELALEELAEKGT